MDAVILFSDRFLKTLKNGLLRTHLFVLVAIFHFLELHSVHPSSLASKHLSPKTSMLPELATLEKGRGGRDLVFQTVSQIFLCFSNSK